MSSPLRFRVLGRDDLPFADSLRALAGWNQTLGDWERFLVTEPTGCFLAEWNGTPAGTATTMVYGPELAWIGMVLVHPDFRRRGIGQGLLRHCINSLRERGVRCIKLDATPLGRTVYEGLGFRDEWTLKRCRKISTRAGELRSSGLKSRIPKRTKAAFMRLITRVRSRTRPSRSRPGRLASSSSRVGMATILQ